MKFANAQGYTLVDENTQATKIVGTLQDITERKLSEREVQRAHELAERSMKVREIFLANMSHEIRTPMNAILGFTRLLVDTPLTDEQRAFVEAIHFSGENLLVIINDILDLSKIRSGKLLIESYEFNMHEVISSILTSLKPKAIEKGLRLNANIVSAIPTALKGDPIRLNQILTNLISNAIKFTSKGSIQLEVNITGHTPTGYTIEFIVQDTGIGIPKEKQGLVFESFTQASGETTRKYGGTGLGLAIVKNLVEMQLGTIGLKSVEGEGSTFMVQLPFARVSERTSTLEVDPSTKPRESFHALMGAKILVAEDNEVNGIFFSQILETAGFDFTLVRDGLQAVETWLHERPLAILMDTSMPLMDGFEATRRIRAAEESIGGHTPIIGVLGNVHHGEPGLCASAGMDDHITKPVSPERLEEKLREWLDGQLLVFPARGDRS